MIGAASNNHQSALAERNLIAGARRRRPQPDYSIPARAICVVVSLQLCSDGHKYDEGKDGNYKTGSGSSHECAVDPDDLDVQQVSRIQHHAAEKEEKDCKAKGEPGVNRLRSSRQAGGPCEANESKQDTAYRPRNQP